MFKLILTEYILINLPFYYKYIYYFELNESIIEYVKGLVRMK